MNLFTAIRNLIKKPDNEISVVQLFVSGNPDYDHDVINTETKISISKDLRHCKHSNRKVSWVFLIPVYKDGKLIENMEFSTGTRIKI
jgi:hypothetical protein